MSFSLLSVAIFLLFIAVMAIEISKCIKKGFRRSLMSLGTVICAIFVSLILTPAISSGIVGLLWKIFISDTSMLEGIVGESSAQMFKQFLADMPNLSIFIKSVISMALSTILFMPIFFIVRGCVNAFVGAIYKSKASKTIPLKNLSEKDSYFDRHDKGLSAITGSLIGIIVMMVLVAPIMGTLEVVDTGFDITDKVSKLSGKSIKPDIMEAIDKYSDDAVGNTFYQMGGKVIYRASANCKMYGKRVYALSEIDVLESSMDDALELYDILKSGEKDVDTSCLYSLSKRVSGIHICHGVFADVLSNSASSWQKGEQYMNMAKPKVTRLIAPTFDRMLGVCAETTEHSVILNIQTALHICAEVLDSGIMKLNLNNYAEVLQFINESGIVTTLDAILAQNPYMSSISVSSIAMSAISEQLLVYNYDAEQYAQLMVEITDSINAVYGKGYASHEERVDALTAYTVKNIEGYGVEVPEDVAHLVASEILRAFENSESVTPESVDELFDSFAQ